MEDDIDYFVLFIVIARQHTRSCGQIFQTLAINYLLAPLLQAPWLLFLLR